MTTVAEIAAGLTEKQREAVIEGRVRDCHVNHPQGTRCPNCAGWPFKKGEAASFVATVAAHLKDKDA